MAGQGNTWGKRRGDSRGAVAVEFALVLPLLGMLLFGIISFGLAFSDKVALANAVREGARFGASTDATSATWGSSVVDRTVAVYANADSPLDQTQVCAVLMDATGHAVQSSSPLCANGTSSVGPLPTATPPSGTQTGSCYVMVWAAKPTDVNWLLHSTTLTLTAQSVGFYDRVSGTTCTYTP